jgi:hypothetical protein
MKEFLSNSEKNPNTVSKKIIDLRVTALVPSSIKMVGAFIIFMFIKIMVENLSFLKHYIKKDINSMQKIFKVLS